RMTACATRWRGSAARSSRTGADGGRKSRFREPSSGWIGDRFALFGLDTRLDGLAGCTIPLPQVIRMNRTLSRRNVLASLVAVPAAAALLAGCSDSGGEAQAQSSSAPASDAPRAAGTVDMAKLLEEGSLPEKVLGEANAPVTIVEYASMTC